MGIFDLPNYPNQILHSVGLFSKIRCSLTISLIRTLPSDLAAGHPSLSGEDLSPIGGVMHPFSNHVIQSRGVVPGGAEGVVCTIQVVTYKIIL